MDYNRSSNCLRQRKCSPISIFILPLSLSGLPSPWHPRRISYSQSAHQSREKGRVCQLISTPSEHRPEPILARTERDWREQRRRIRTPRNMHLSAQHLLHREPPRAHHIQGRCPVLHPATRSVLHPLYVSAHADPLQASRAFSPSPLPIDTSPTAH